MPEVERERRGVSMKERGGQQQQLQTEQRCDCSKPFDATRFVEQQHRSRGVDPMQGCQGSIMILMLRSGVTISRYRLEMAQLPIIDPV